MDVSVRWPRATLTTALKSLHYSVHYTLQYPVLLAPLAWADSEEVILRELRIVASYLDIVIARCIWNWKSTSYSTMQYSMFQRVINIRGKPVEKLADILAKLLETQKKDFLLWRQTGTLLRTESTGPEPA